MKRALSAVTLLALATGCESAWRKENALQAEWMGYAEKPRAHDLFDVVEHELPELEEKCRADRWGTCLRAGRLLLFDSREVEAGRAKPLLFRECTASLTDEHADPKTCTFLGIALLWGGADLAAEPALGHRLLGERCATGDTLACAYQGFAVETGAGAARDVDRATALYEKACSIEQKYRAIAHGEAPPKFASTREPMACWRLGALEEHGIRGGDLALAAQLYADVCLLAEGPDDRVRLQACERGAPLFLAHAYTFQSVDPPLGPIGADLYGDLVDSTFDGANAADLATAGCYDGGERSCEVLKIVFELRESQGNLFDLRPALDDRAEPRAR